MGLIIHRDMIPLASEESEKTVPTIIYAVRGRFNLSQKMMKPAR